MFNSSQAYQLFSEGKTPIQVAIKLGLKEPEVHEFYKQYWKLQQLYSLYQVHEHVKEDIWSFVESYRLIKAAGMDLEHVKRLLEIANNDLSYLFSLLSLFFIFDTHISVPILSDSNFVV